MTRIEKLAEARRLLTRALTPYVTIGTWQDLIGAVGLTLDLVEDFTKPRGDAPQDGTESGAQDTPASPGAALSPAPDFAAMARTLDSYLENSDEDEALYVIEEFLMRYWHKPAPALVRDEAWWIARMREFWDRYNDPTVETTFHDTARHVFAKYLGADPAPAFDVEALVNGVLNGLLGDGWSDMQVGMICSTLRAVAREMLKGGGR